MDASELLRAEPFFGPVIYAAYTTVILYIGFTLLISIISIAHDEVRKKPVKSTNLVKLASYVVGKERATAWMSSFNEGDHRRMLVSQDGHDHEEAGEESRHGDGTPSTHALMQELADIKAELRRMSAAPAETEGISGTAARRHQVYG
eukprot:TRINITY_DN8855_c0_g1_i3.p1 TRINITY_DN8855_c0_g1~~TRINITY_DN8855_c0_g1_i3.p1  ORF type:complete len:147 (-),score=27.92 TRINITY_DN8855_c0_g1_i3:252-692(-)